MSSAFLEPLNSAFFMGNDRLSGKQVGSQASRRVTPAWIQPVCISINAVPALKGLNFHNLSDDLDIGMI